MGGLSWAATGIVGHVGYRVLMVYFTLGTAVVVEVDPLDIVLAGFGGIPGLEEIDPDLAIFNVFLISVSNVHLGFCIYMAIRSAIPTLPGDG